MRHLQSLEVKTEVIGIEDGFIPSAQPSVPVLIHFDGVHPPIFPQIEQFPCTTAICGTIVAALVVVTCRIKRNITRQNGSVRIEKRDSVTIRAVKP